MSLPHESIRAALTAARGVDKEIVAPALQKVAIRGVVAAPLLEVELEQEYRNDSGDDLEVVYTFPLPPRAALTALSFRIGDSELCGCVVARREAADRYEDTVASGDSVVLVESAANGAFTAQLGNLRAGETAVVRLRYAQLAEAAGDAWRIAIPTVLAPLYGDAVADGGLQPHQEPLHSMTVEYPLALTLEIRGAWGVHDIESPSHAIAIAPGEAGLRVTAQGVLDRDFVLRLARKTPATAVAAASEGEHVGLVSLVVPETAVRRQPCSLRIVLDCSGSMAGEAIDWATVACQRVIARLSDEDEFAITRFGSSHEHWQPQPVAADAEQRRRAEHWLGGIAADLGGTEMESALQAAAALHGRAAADLLLITDGQIWSTDALIRWARRAGLRIFVVGVGSAPHAAFLRTLAQATGGRCEIVSPGENLDGAAQRLLTAIKTPSAAPSVRWPQPPLWEVQFPPRPAVGDTVHCFAGFAQPPTGEVQLDVGGQPLPPQRLEGGAPLPALVRLAALERIRAGHFEKPAAAAERYQLVTEWTSLIAVAVRAAEDKAGALPALAVVPSMLPAGWGGFGASVPWASRDAAALARLLTQPSVHCRAPIDHCLLPADAASADRAAAPRPSFWRFLTARPEEALWKALPQHSEIASAFTRLTRRLLRARLGDEAPAWTLETLRACGLPAALIESLRALAAEASEPAVCATLYLVLAAHYTDAPQAARSAAEQMLRTQTERRAKKLRRAVVRALARFLARSRPAAGAAAAQGH